MVAQTHAVYRSQQHSPSFVRSVSVQYLIARDSVIIFERRSELTQMAEHSPPGDLAWSHSSLPPRAQGSHSAKAHRISSMGSLKSVDPSSHSEIIECFLCVLWFWTQQVKWATIRANIVKSRVGCRLSQLRVISCSDVRVWSITGYRIYHDDCRHRFQIVPLSMVGHTSASQGK